jgi:hypothetical protein
LPSSKLILAAQQGIPAERLDLFAKVFDIKPLSLSIVRSQFYRINMTDLAEKMDHPYIISRAVYVGSPVIRDEIPRRSVNYILQQASPEELVSSSP